MSEHLYIIYTRGLSSLYLYGINETYYQGGPLEDSLGFHINNGTDICY